VVISWVLKKPEGGVDVLGTPCSIAVGCGGDMYSSISSYEEKLRKTNYKLGLTVGNLKKMTKGRKWGT